MIRTTAIALLACATVVLGCNRDRPDATVNAAVMAKLDREPSLAGGTVASRTEAGHVYLSGTVPTAEQRRRAQDLADDVTGVKEITNDIQVSTSAAPSAPPSTTTPGTMNPPLPNTAPSNPNMPDANPPVPNSNPAPPPGPESNETPPPSGASGSQGDTP
jgi:BON domain-containing protein